MTDTATDDVDGDIEELEEECDWSPLCIEFTEVKSRMMVRHIKTKVDFATAEREFRALLEDFLPRVVEPEDLAINLGLEFRRRIVESILSDAETHDEPFETCQRLWNELVVLGFSTIEIRCLMSHGFVRSCLQYGQTDMGLALLDPLIAELERLRAEPSVTEQAAKYYDGEIESLRKLRARLEAERDQ